jgi:hypothetical protein
MSKKSSYNVALVGATGAVGETLIGILAERRFPVADFVPLASARSVGEKVALGARQVSVRDLDTFDFKGIDIAFFSAGGAVSRVHAPRAAAAGAVVIDNTSEFRREADIPHPFVSCREQRLIRHICLTEQPPPKAGIADRRKPLPAINPLPFAGTPCLERTADI